MLYQAVGFPKKLEQPILLGGREGFPTILDWRTSAPKDKMPFENTYSLEAVMKLNTHRTPIQKQPEALLCLVGLSRRYFLGDEVYPTFLHDDDRGGNGRPGRGNRLFGEAVAPEVPPSENVTTTGVALEAGQAEWIAVTGPHVIKECRKRGNDGGDTNAPPKVLRRDHDDSRPTQSTHGGKSVAAMGLGMGSTRPVPASRGAPVDVSYPNPLSFADPQSRPTADVARSSNRAAAAGDPESENTSFTSMDLVDHIAPPGYFSELRHLHNNDFLKQYNVNLARQVAMGSQLRLRFEQEAKLLNKSVAQVARRDKRIQARENEIKNLETLLEAETSMKKTAKGKSAKLSKELENLRALFSDLQVSNNPIAGRRWVIGHGLRLAVMKCDESTELRQVFADVVSAGIAKGMSDGLKYGVEHGKANLSLEEIEAYDPEAEAKYIAALHALKDLKYPIVDQLENLKDAPMDVIMASLHLESDTGDDAPQWIYKLRPSSSQLKIPMYQEARDPTDPWACKKEILLADAIAGNNAVQSNPNGNGNLVAARAEGNATGHNENQIRCYNCRGVGHFARNCTVRPKRRDAAYLQTQLLIAQKEEAGIQLQAKEFDLMAVVADLDEIEEVIVNCILMANLQQASTS
nr:transposase (putative), gypsy type [Tanacetum cinerariifolium]